MTRLGPLLVIAALALSGGVTRKTPEPEAKQEPAPESAAPAQSPVRARPEVIPLNTRGYNLPGPNDPPPAAIEASPEPAPASAKPR